MAPIPTSPTPRKRRHSANQPLCLKCHSDPQLGGICCFFPSALLSVKFLLLLLFLLSLLLVAKSQRPRAGLLLSSNCSITPLESVEGWSSWRSTYGQRGSAVTPLIAICRLLLLQQVSCSRESLSPSRLPRAVMAILSV